MGKLIKSAVVTYIPGNPGNPGSPYIPAQPGRWSEITTAVCTTGEPTYRVVRVYPWENLFVKLGYPAGASAVSGVTILSNTCGSPQSGYICSYNDYLVALYGSSCTYTTRMVYTPPTVAIAAVPASPPTQSQITYAMNQGWNSYARTVGELLPGTYIEYTIKPGTYGALMAKDILWAR